MAYLIRINHLIPHDEYDDGEYFSEMKLTNAGVLVSEYAIYDSDNELDLNGDDIIFPDGTTAMLVDLFTPRFQGFDVVDAEAGSDHFEGM